MPGNGPRALGESHQEPGEHGNHLHPLGVPLLPEAIPAAAKMLSLNMPLTMDASCRLALAPERTLGTGRVYGIRRWASVIEEGAGRVNMSRCSQHENPP